MKRNYNDAVSTDIDDYVYDILKQSKTFDIFPTPVTTILAYAELCVDKQYGLHNIPNHYISKKLDLLRNALKKVYGALDRRKKIIYLNPELNSGKKVFVQLHEVGHHVLPWQRDVYEFMEDEESLSPDVEERFEAEANHFASASLFQLNRFDNEISSLPLSLATIKYLAGKFGASLQATFRRYVEKSEKRIGLLVLHKPAHFGGPLQVRNWIVSRKFAAAFQHISFPEFLTKHWPFVRDYYSNRVWIDEPKDFELLLEDNTIPLQYRYCYNRHNIFILVTPIGEKVRSSTNFLIG